MSSVLILTPLVIENVALIEALIAAGGPTEISHNGVKVFSYPDSQLHVAVGGHGKVQFALSTQLLIQKLKPRLVICAGAAGILDPRMMPLDVVVSEVTIEHDFRLRFVERPLPRFPADLKTLETLRRRAGWEHFRVHFGNLASGDEDIIDAPRAQEIRATTAALAVAWEGAGGARACQFHGVPFVEIRAVTDSCDDGSARSFTDNIRVGMNHVARVIEQIL